MTFPNYSPKRVHNALLPPGEQMTPEEDETLNRYGARGPPILKNSKESIRLFDDLFKFIESNRENKLKILIHITSITNIRLENFRNIQSPKSSRVRNHECKSQMVAIHEGFTKLYNCLLYTSPSPRDRTRSRMPSSA